MICFVGRGSLGLFRAFLIAVTKDSASWSFNFLFFILVRSSSCARSVVDLFGLLRSAFSHHSGDLAHFPCALSIRVHAARCFLS